MANSKNSKKALPGKSGSYTWMKPTDLTIIGIDTDDGPEHFLCDFERNASEINPEFLASVAEQGVISTIDVWKDNGLNIVVAGRRRVRAARIINEGRIKAGRMDLIEIKAISTKGDEIALMGRMASENEHRDNDSVPVKISKCKRMLASGVPAEKLVIFFGVTRQTISNWTKVGESSINVQQAVEDGSMSLLEAAEVSNKPLKEQKEVAKKAKEKVASGEKKGRGRPKGSTMSRKRQCQVILDAVEKAGKKVLVHPDFAQGLRFALDMIDAKTAGVDEILTEAIKAKAEAKATKKPAAKK